MKFTRVNDHKSCEDTWVTEAPLHGHPAMVLKNDLGEFFVMQMRPPVTGDWYSMEVELVPLKEWQKRYDAAPKPSPPATPSLDLLRRFAKVAGWREKPNNWSGFPNAAAFEIPVSITTTSDCTGTLWIETEKCAGDWLNSQAALDAAAVVAFRQGHGLMLYPKHSDGPFVAQIYWTLGRRSGDEMASAESKSRAAVLACLAAFEEKP